MRHLYAASFVVVSAVAAGSAVAVSRDVSPPPAVSATPMSAPAVAARDNLNCATAEECAAIVVGGS